MKRHLKFSKSLFFCAFLICIGNSDAATTILPDIISNNMILKQKSNVALWGWDKPKTNIAINTGWNNKEYRTKTDKNGQWKIFVKTPAAGGPYNILIEGTDRISLSDILIGEVWFTSGQSNMGWSFFEEKDGLKFIKNINNKKIRLFLVPHRTEEKECKRFENNVAWKNSNAETLKYFSSMSYYFAARLQERLNVPIGIISASWAGTGIESWISSDLQNSDNQLKKSIDRWNGWLGRYKEDSIKYENTVTLWKKDSVNDAIRARVKMPKSLYMISRPHNKPGGPYNGMICPCIPYAISGLIWYQGENSVEWADEYEHQLESLIDSWRNSWNQNFPVLVGQLTNFNYPSPEKAAVLRAAQLKMTKKKGTYVICTIDIGNPENVHPVDKKPFGKRFADMALNKIYGFKEFPADYPMVNKAERTENKILITFHNAKGLQIKGNELNDVLIWEDNNKKVKAQTQIKENRLIIYSDSIRNPAGVSYAVDNNVKANLYNEYDLPAYPFILKLKH